MARLTSHIEATVQSAMAKERAGAALAHKAATDRMELVASEARAADRLEREDAARALELRLKAQESAAASQLQATKAATAACEASRAALPAPEDPDARAARKEAGRAAERLVLVNMIKALLPPSAPAPPPVVAPPSRPRRPLLRRRPWRPCRSPPLSRPCSHPSFRPVRIPPSPRTRRPAPSTRTPDPPMPLPRSAAHAHVSAGAPGLTWMPASPTPDVPTDARPSGGLRLPPPPWMGIPQPLARLVDWMTAPPPHEARLGPRDTWRLCRGCGHARGGVPVGPV